MSDLVTLEQVAEQTGRKKCAVRQWRQRYPDFPPSCCPSWFPMEQPLFNWADVRLWLVLRGWWDPVAEVPEAWGRGRPSAERLLMEAGR